MKEECLGIIVEKSNARYLLNYGYRPVKEFKNHFLFYIQNEDVDQVNNYIRELNLTVWETDL